MATTTTGRAHEGGTSSQGGSRFSDRRARNSHARRRSRTHRVQACAVPTVTCSPIALWPGIQYPELPGSAGIIDELGAGAPWKQGGLAWAASAAMTERATPAGAETQQLQQLEGPRHQL